MTTEFILAPGEEFIQCPYNTAHQITNARFLTHLDKCRKSYLKDLTVEGRSKNMRICRHNAIHHVPKPEIKFHEERCPDAHSIVRHMAYHNSEEGNRQYEERRRRDEANRQYEERRHRDEANRKYEEGRRRDSDRFDRSRSGHSSSSSIKRESSYRSHPEPEDVKPPINPNDWGLEEEDWESESMGYVPGYNPLDKLKTEVVMYNPQGLTKSERKKFRQEVRVKAELSSMGIGNNVELPTATTFDIKPDINNLTISVKKERAQSPLEPGEIDDDEDDQYGENVRSSNSTTYATRQPENRHKHDNNQQNWHRPSSTTYQHHSTHSSSRGADKPRKVFDDFEPDDSDDFEGIDPYA